MTNEQIATNMRGILAECLCSPGGDPTDEHLSAAAIAFHVLDGIGLLTTDDEGYRATLEGENGCEENFLLRNMAYGMSPIVRAEGA